MLLAIVSSWNEFRPSANYNQRIYYRPQMKLRKGNVFTSVSRILSTGIVFQTPPLDRLGSKPPPTGQTPPPRQTPLLGRYPLGRHPRADTPRHTATAADGTHPTGIHSCLFFMSTINNGSYTLHGTGTGTEMDTIENNGFLSSCSV